ncbi:hypothetical protein AB1Y20_012802 [Prymnesium parvum]|uniref:Vesicle tethering protein Uso1/P115-like head domain-containing protein n=1 Tax=Prymnesium parvum TaxID=97485 RepID=A0AB34IKV3_PRYPA
MPLFGSLLGTAPKKSAGALLLERLGGAAPLEERREAIVQFKELSAAQPLRLIDKGGFSVLAALLRLGDTEISRETLETLANLMDPQVPRDDLAAAAVKAAHNASVFLSNTENLATATGVVDDADVYVKFHAITLLIRLLSVAQAEAQATVLSQPEVIRRVLLLLEEKREIVRNEALLLLARLAGANADLQNILAFQGANEQLLTIIEGEVEENGLGSVIAHDCLRLVRTIVAGNVPSCRVFTETACLPRLVPLLRLPPSHTKEEATCARLVCDLLAEMLSCVRHHPADRQSMQASLLRLDTLLLLLGHLTNPSTATEPQLRLSALCALADLLFLHAAACDAFLAATASRRHAEELVEEPAAPRLLYVSLRSASAAWRAASLRLFACLFSHAPHAQAAAAASLHAPPPPPLASHLPLATMAMSALLHPQEEGGAAWLGGGVVCALLDGNRQTRRLAAALPAAEGGTLLHACAKLLFASLREGRAALLLLALLRLLFVWVCDCREAAEGFCAPTANLPSLLDAIAAPREDVHIRGHLAALLGACLVTLPQAAPSTADAASPPADEPSPPPITRELLVQMVTRRVGLEAYTEAWEAMLRSDAYLKACEDRPWRASEADEQLKEQGVHGAIVYTAASAQQLRRCRDEAHAHILHAYSQPAVDGTPRSEAPPAAAGEIDPAIESFKEMIRAQDEQLQAVQREAAELREKLAAAHAQLEETEALRAELAEARAMLASREANGGADGDQAALEQLREQARADRSEVEALAATCRQLEGELLAKDAEINSLRNKGGGEEVQTTGNAMEQAAAEEVSIENERLAHQLAILGAQLDEANAARSRFASEAAAAAEAADDARIEAEEARAAARRAAEQLREAVAAREALEAQLAAQRQECSGSVAPGGGAQESGATDSLALERDLEVARGEISALREEQEELLLCLAEQDEAAQELQAQLHFAQSASWREPPSTPGATPMTNGSAT